MTYWLFKSEPDAFSIDDLKKAGEEFWDGVRNYQARNLLRNKIKVGDKVLFYHSSCKVPAVVGIAEVSRGPAPDPSQFDKGSPYFDAKSTTDKPRWYGVTVKYLETLPNQVTLATIRADGKLSDMVLVRRGRLSVQPVTAKEWRRIMTLSKRP